MAVKKRTQVSYGLSDPLIVGAPQPIVSQRDPSGADFAPLGTLWVNTITGNFFVITQANNNHANWNFAALNVFNLGQVQTNNAVATALFQFQLVNNRAVAVYGWLAGSKADFSASIWGNIICGARRAGGGSVLVGAPVVNSANDSGTGVPTFGAAVVGNSIVIQVTGEAATVYNWQGWFNVVLS